MPNPDPTNPALPSHGPPAPGRLAPPAAIEENAQSAPVESRLLAIQSAARYHGVDLDRTDLRIPPGESPSPATLIGWVRNSGLWARAVRINWRQLLKLQGGAPVVLLFNDGSAGLHVGVNAPRQVVFLKDPRAPQAEEPVPVDELRLNQVWNGQAILIRRERGTADEDAPFSLNWILRVVMKERRFLSAVGFASIAMSFLTILPPLLVMIVINKVLQYHSLSTLIMLSALIGVAVLYETILGYARRELTQVIAARLDARLNLHIFSRLLALPLDYFERHPTGDTTYKIHEIYRIREFLTGRMLQTFLDLITLLVLLPVLFWMSPTLTWFVVAAAMLIGLIILVFLPPIRRAIGRSIQAEIEKNTVLIESVHGIRTVKSMAMEPIQKEVWDLKVATASRRRLEAGRLSNWPATLTTPVEAFAQRGVLLIGAYFAITGENVVDVGGLLAFMMLGMRVAAPLVGLARLIEDFEEVRNSIGQVASVLNNPTETSSAQTGLRPRFAGAISFENVTFTYPGSKSPALEKVTFSIPAGTMLGLVGKSGSGKSTVARLLQGINREYEGFLKIDGTDLREINLAHLRRSFGVVLQDNFLFRGTIRENIIAGRPGLTLSDAVRAARLAGAEEFIERMPGGYETFIQEGSTNLSGGQKQRLAIARALISDPRILILDEATSALDPESEALVNANLQRIARGRTMVIVSHRLSSLVDSDLILVLDQGKVMDIGPHRELVERCPVYRQLWLQQNRHLTNHGQRAAATPALAQGD